MLINQSEYLSMLTDIRNDIQTSQHRAMLSANQTMIEHYWRIGQTINAHKVWGSKFIDVLSCDIHQDFPQAKGYSVRNLKYMAKLADTYSYEFVQQTVAQIPWGHNIVIMDKVHSEEERIWYINKTVENAWSRDVLIHQIESNLYQRQVLAQK